MIFKHIIVKENGKKSGLIIVWSIATLKFKTFTQHKYKKLVYA